jgi:uncharacterized protein (TIGR02118 family)
MIKLMMVWSDAPDKTAEECDEHYLGVHTQMAHAVLHDVPGFVKYTQNRVVRHFVHNRNGRAAEDRTPDFDRSIELWFTDQAALQAVFNRPEMDLMFQDHPNFMDVDGSPSQRVYILDERVDSVRDRSGTLYVPSSTPSTFDWASRVR